MSERRYHMPGVRRRIFQWLYNFVWIWNRLRQGRLPRVWFPYGRGVSQEAMDWAASTAPTIDRTLDASQFESFADFRARVLAKQATEKE